MHYLLPMVAITEPGEFTLRYDGCLTDVEPRIGRQPQRSFEGGVFRSTHSRDGRLEATATLAQGRWVAGSTTVAANSYSASSLSTERLVRSYAERVLVIGEAAGQVKATTGGGQAGRRNDRHRLRQRLLHG